MNHLKQSFVLLCAITMPHVFSIASQGENAPKKEQTVYESTKKETMREIPSERREERREDRGIVRRTWDSASDIAHNTWHGVKRFFGFE